MVSVDKDWTNTSATVAEIEVKESSKVAFGPHKKTGDSSQERNKEEKKANRKIWTKSYIFSRHIHRYNNQIQKMIENDE